MTLLLRSRPRRASASSRARWNGATRFTAEYRGERVRGSSSAARDAPARRRCSRGCRAARSGEHGLDQPDPVGLPATSQPPGGCRHRRRRAPQPVDAARGGEHGGPRRGEHGGEPGAETGRGAGHHGGPARKENSSAGGHVHRRSGRASAPPSRTSVWPVIHDDASAGEEQRGVARRPRRCRAGAAAASR